MANNKITEAFIEIVPDFGGFKTALTEGFSYAFGSSATSIAASFDAAGRELFKKFSIPLAVATAANVAQFQALEREINTVLTLFGTAPGLVDETFGAMSQGVREVAREVGGLEKDIAGGLYQAISAGVPKDSVFEFLDVAQMAAMADKAADLTVAVDGISTAVNAFSGEGLSAAKASDILFAGVAAGKTTFAELGSSIGRAAGLAANAGVQFTEFIASIAQMTKSGIATSEAVSYMRAAVTSLLRPSEDMNRIFQEIGFATAEAAVPVIGLQQSLQTLVDATGGSTSKLQELLGSAEAVTTVLAITGEKSEAFSQTLRGMENAAGSTESAYNIMERGVGRSFGRLTEAFDQLGNIFGEMGSAVVQPVVDSLASAVSGLGEIFEGFIPVAQAFGAIIENAMQVFDVPIIGAFTEGILAMGIALSGLLGVLGLVLVPLASFIKLLFLTKVLVQFKNFAALASGALLTFGKAMNEAVLRGGLFGQLLGKLQAGLARLTTGLLTTTGAIAASFAALAVAAGVVYGLSKAFQVMRDSADQARRQQDILGDGIDRLLESAGIAQNELPRVYGLADDEVNTLRQSNSLLLTELERIQNAYGDAVAQDLLLTVGAELVWEGATPDEAYDIITGLATERGLTVPLNLEGFGASVESVETALDGVQGLAIDVGAATQTAVDAWGNYNSNGAIAAQVNTEALSKALAKLLVTAESAGEVDLFQEGLLDVESEIGNAEVFQELLQNIVGDIEELQGEDIDLGIDENKIETAEDFFKALQDVNRIAEDFETPKLVDPGLTKDLVADEFFADMKSNLADLPTEINGVVALTGEQGAVLHQMIQDTDAVFAAALTSIEESQAAITAGLEAQIPVFGNYEAAAELSATAMETAAAAWQADVDLVAGSRELLEQNLTPAEFEIFNQQSIADQAGFLKGTVEDVQSKIESFKTLAASTDTLEDVRLGEEMGRIMEEANTILETGITELITKGGAAGQGVTDAYLEKFESENGARIWGPKAQEYWNEVEGVIGAEIKGPTVTAPTFVGGSTTYTISVSAGNSSNPGRDVARGLQYVGAGGPQQ